MPKFQLQLKAELENIEEIKISDGYEWFLLVECSQCHEKNDAPVTLNAHEEYEVPNSRGTANLIMKCKFCKKDCSASIDKNSIKSYKDSGRYAPIATIEGRGIDIVGWEPREGLVLKSSVSEALWKDVGLDDDWAEYDDNGGEPVGVSEIETKVERTK